MTSHTPAERPAVDEVLAELAENEDPELRTVNQRQGNDIGVNLTTLCNIAQRLKTQHELAVELWDTEDTQARLVTILISEPGQYTIEEVDAMLREARVPKLLDWLTTYIVIRHPEAEDRRLLWMEDSNQNVAVAGWTLTSHLGAKHVDNLNAPGLLEWIEETMGQAPERLQWAMNECLVTIGVHYPEHRTQAIEIGERLGLLKDYPTPSNGLSPYAPMRIQQLVSRSKQLTRHDTTD